jgi:hypothetical protein
MEKGVGGYGALSERPPPAIPLLTIEQQGSTASLAGRSGPTFALFGPWVGA